MPWAMIARDETWEFWAQIPDGVPLERMDGNTEVYRRRASRSNIISTTGAPQGARWECFLNHFRRYWLADVEVLR